MTQTVNIGLIGAPGKMITRIAALLAREPGCALKVALAKPGDPAIGQDIGTAAGGAPLGTVIEALSPDAFTRAAVWIDFSHPEVALANAQAAVRAKKALVVGTTGLGAAEIAGLREAATKVPILQAANTSLGVAVLNAALKLALEALGPTYAAEIVELHHDKKRDAPSGTALRLVETIHAARGTTPAQMRCGREGDVGQRAADEVGVFAVRGGQIVGEHTVYLIGENERLELTHRAASRDLFAEGAIRAARWLAGQGPGFYRIEDCLGLK